jgi:hypothetical protein
MSAVGWILFSFVAGLAALYVAYVYRRREMPGRGRRGLAALRVLALALLLLVVFNPELPTAERLTRRPPAVLLDGSLSMTLPAVDGSGSVWDAAKEEARRLAGGSPVLVFDRSVRAVTPQALGELTPVDAGARLLPALRAAAESGARRVVVVTDGRIEDAAEVARWLPALRLDLEFRTMGGEPPANRALIEAEAPAWAESGRPIEVRFGVAATGGATDSVTVRVLQDGRVLGEARTVAAAWPRIASGSIGVTPQPPPSGGFARLEVALEPGDAIPDDDRRSLYVFVTDQPVGVALVSFAPDWEPRFLEPVLAQALGLPIRGYLRLTADGYHATGVGLGIGAAATEEEVRRAAGRADLLVLHGLDEAAPAWARELAGRHPRVLVLAGTTGGDVGLPVRPGAPLPAEWYADADPPASPIAPLLAGIDVADAPPLTTLRPVSPQTGVWVALEATRGRQGVPLPLAVAGEDAGRRWVLATGDGYWRWAFRGDASRQLYARFWGALSGWLVRERAVATDAEVRPARRAIERGGAIAWRAPEAVDSLVVRLRPHDGGELEAVLLATRGDSVAQPAPPPGHYEYEVVAYAADQARAAGRGELTVESYSPEFSRSAVSVAELAASPAAVGETADLPGRPLRAATAPYILIVMLLAAEWALRRRWGLR